MTAPEWAAMGFLTVVCTVFGFLVWSWALQKTEAARLGAVVYLIPLVTVCSELLWFGRAPSIGLVTGGSILITGVVIAET